MPKFRKKPAVIEAKQFRVDMPETVADIIKWCDGKARPVVGWKNQIECLAIYTLEGAMEAKDKDWVVKGVQGEFYPCKPDIFEATHELID